ncbi:MAG: choice-of-anchor tandem repeat GloVer-containing protein [Candidatus Korobacteraceae bacterium]|jgi:hypothetical protein
MTRVEQHRSSQIARLAGTAGLLILLVTAIGAQAQTLTVLHAFTGGADGANPGGSGLSIDRAGNLYGGTDDGGLQGSQCYGGGTCGTIFKLSRRSSGWTFDTLYSFHGSDGATPDAPVVFGPDGALYGTTFYGGTGCFNGCGNVFRLQPGLTFCASAFCPWTQTVLYEFTGGSDGSQPAFGALSFDAAGNTYGTSTGNGNGTCGTVFELAHNGSQWTFNLLWTFTGYLDGCSSWSGVTFDQAGNLYGTTTEGGADEYGTAFELSPYGQGWSLTPLHQFANSSDGSGPFGNLIFGPSGGLLGTNREGGPGDAGGVFELVPSSGGWNFSVLHSFDGENGPQAPLLMDSAGNLYGTSVDGGRYRWGFVFKMTSTGLGYTYTDLYDFTGGSDGGWPYGQIVMDANGNLYGTTEEGGIRNHFCGSYGCGVVWELTP